MENTGQSYIGWTGDNWTTSYSDITFAYYLHINSNGIRFNTYVRYLGLSIRFIYLDLIFSSAGGWWSDTDRTNVGSYGYSWSTMLNSSSYSWYMYFNSSRVTLSYRDRRYGFSIRILLI